jgi:hypothetical protein
MNEVVETRKRVLGSQHPDTLGSMQNLAMIWKSQRRDEEATSLMLQTEGLLRRQLGFDHPTTMVCTRILRGWQEG